MDRKGDPRAFLIYPKLYDKMNIKDQFNSASEVIILDI